MKIPLFSLDVKNISKQFKGPLFLVLSYIKWILYGTRYTGNYLKEKSSFTNPISSRNPYFTGFKKDYELNNDEQYFIINELETYEIILE